MHSFIRRLRAAFVSLCIIMIVGACDSGGPGGGSFTAYTWTNVSPDGGFISSVTFHPTNPGEVWLSADDGGGLYKSVDSGNSWALLNTQPPDQSTYALVFDPSNPATVYAPNHFGRGFLKTNDAGLTWEIAGSGLPTDEPGKRIHDMIVDPVTPSTLYVASAAGLYMSTDAGISFTQVTSSAFVSADPKDTDFRAVVGLGGALPMVFVGTASGRVYKTTNSGQTWTEITTVSTVAVTDLASTPNALYIAYDQGLITRTRTFDNSDLSLINDIFNPAHLIDSGSWTKLIAIAGVSAATDRLYVGTVSKQGSIKWGFFESTDGGASFAKRGMFGLKDISVFSMAVNPQDPDHIVSGTVNEGVLVSLDAGDSWTAGTDVIATTSTAFGEDPDNSDHLLMSSTAGLSGTSKVFETQDNGNSWTEIETLADKNVASLLFVSNSPGTILAGTFRDGIYQTTTGSSGPWTQVLVKTVKTNRIRSDRINPSTIYALAMDDDVVAPAVPADVGIYVSTDAGGAWVQRVFFGVLDVIPHPTREGEAVVVGVDVFGTTDSFATALVELDLDVFAPGKIFTTAAFDPNNPARLIVGTLSGELYMTTNYAPDGIGVTWAEITIPAASVKIVDIEIVSRTTGDSWYVACWVGDTFVQADSTPGLLLSNDDGVSWDFLDVGLYPSRLIFKFSRSPTVAGRFYAGMWGGGFMRFED